MDEDFLTREFEAVLQDEPPLGFDPDDVVASAARRQRRRRMTLLAGGGVVAVAVAAICVPLAVTRDGGAATERIAAADPSTAQMWPASRLTQPTLPESTLTGLMSDGRQHFALVATKMFPDVTSVSKIQGTAGNYVTWVVGRSEGDIHQQGYGVTGTVASGQHLIDLQLDVKMPHGESAPAPLTQQCDLGQDNNCTYDHPASGEVVVTSHEVYPLSKTDAAHQLRPAEVLLVKDLRPDGTEVDVQSTTTIGEDPGHVLATRDQLTALARDPAFGP